MKDFKLVALRPLEGCDIKFLKIIKPELPYVFYNAYDFSNYSSKSRMVVLKTEKLAPDFYTFNSIAKKEVKLNISAIVGENGSGKSSLIELLYVACYNISVIKGVLYDDDESRYLNLKDSVPNINIEIFYQIDNKLHLLYLFGTTITLYELVKGEFMPSKNQNLNLNNFFYSLCINYSLHALNSRVLGDWLKKVFHKNDSYQTPIVLNPYREEGKIDINNEDYLIRSRLITNILGKIGPKIRPEESLRNIIDKKTAHRLIVSLNKGKFEHDEKGKPNFKYSESIGEKILPLVYQYFLKNRNFKPHDTKLNQYAKEYILSKLKNIATRYQPYKRLFQFFDEDISSHAEGFIVMLSQDKSHVTFKLRQAINFLNNDLYFKRSENFNLTIAYLSRELEEKKTTEGKELIDLLPPSFFDIDIEFKDLDRFSHLSSGEKQRVYSIATLIYHLNNLSSADRKLVDLKYERINVVFDELELYFHPELQRNLVNDIIQNIKKIDLKEIYAINMVLITHSPFILSDIPDQNIIFLTENGGPNKDRENIRTFGGNIHELLAHSFFLKNGFIGEFAKERIQEVITDLQLEEVTNKEKTITTQKKRLDHKLILKKINLIGEPFLKKTLMEMYYTKFDKQKRLSELREEIRRLEND